MTIHETCHRKRKELGLTQKALAEMTGLHRSAVSRFESGRAVSTTTLDKIMRVLKIEFCDY